MNVGFDGKYGHNSYDSFNSQYGHDIQDGYNGHNKFFAPK